MNKSKNFYNYWLTGFIDSDGSFQIKKINHKNGKIEIRLKLQISQKDEYILKDIQEFLCNTSIVNNTSGTYLGVRKHLNNNKEIIYTYYLETTSFGMFKNVINYIDHYPLITYKQLNYFFIRKAYLLIQNKKHLTKEGLNKIIKYKDKMKYLSN